MELKYEPYITRSYCEQIIYAEIGGSLVEVKMLAEANESDSEIYDDIDINANSKINEVSDFSSLIKMIEECIESISGYFMMHINSLRIKPEVFSARAYSDYLSESNMYICFDSRTYEDSERQSSLHIYLDDKIISSSKFIREMIDKINRCSEDCVLYSDEVVDKFYTVKGNVKEISIPFNRGKLW